VLLFLSHESTRSTTHFLSGAERERARYFIISPNMTHTVSERVCVLREPPVADAGCVMCVVPFMYDEQPAVRLTEHEIASPDDEIVIFEAA